MILLDLDGVLRDFVAASLRVHGREGLASPDFPNTWNYFEAWGMNADQFWQPIHDTGSDFWANLKPFPEMKAIVDCVGRLDPDFRICTTPSQDASCYHGNRLWLDKHFGPEFTRIHITAKQGRPGSPRQAIGRRRAAQLQGPSSPRGATP